MYVYFIFSATSCKQRYTFLILQQIDKNIHNNPRLNLWHKKKRKRNTCSLRILNHLHYYVRVTLRLLCVKLYFVFQLLFFTESFRLFIKRTLSIHLGVCCTLYALSLTELYFLLIKRYFLHSICRT